ncbi:hypothetical protein ALQ39_02394 [Pseudomonas amygdali pv. eriobotryae]|uniref:Uncharacterized protein n=1 Tax=Pseudomonas amygdali pv. eriobotryae TaxID=129137 RepID=A0A3M3WUH5_PSEA0|nr:hypothetical protein ALQ39_02394 [Pseudomonas amygdali pv. eriobotryae]
MTAITLDADIKARWPQGHCSHSPGNPEELMIIAVDLLIKELGTHRGCPRLHQPGTEPLCHGRAAGLMHLLQPA